MDLIGNQSLSFASFIYFIIYCLISMLFYFIFTYVGTSKTLKLVECYFDIQFMRVYVVVL